MLAVGERIIKLREQKQWNQKELAQKINMNVSVMNRIEKGTRPLTDTEIVKIAEVFGVSTDYLLTGKDYRFEAEQLLRSGNASTAASDGNSDIEKRIERIERALRLQEGRKPGDKQKDFYGD
ncbi:MULTISPECIES: helix-turn-helix domain-containing protein [Bacillus]|uniref:helix-turn-helix domain-containing protein n=1 Tax=Bacillus TaxID=1386 RepID=UPI00214CDC3E|nr:helix-turn-helix transcriptional regulator [Bacillus pumilus]